MATSDHSKIVKNKSKAGGGNFGYNYASLADIAKQGFEIPKMRVRPVFTPDGSTFVGDYFEFMDENGEWQLGSRIADARELTEIRGNICQKMGSAQTYSRRYTALMALGLSCEDDKAVETTEGRGQSQDRPPTEKQLEYLLKLLNEAGQETTMDELKSKIKTASIASATIKKYEAKS